MAKLKAAIVGAGFIAARKHIPALRKQRARVDLAAICDSNEAAGREVASRFGIPSVYTDVARMLAEESPDLVDVCTPPKTHRPVAVEALEHGSNVLIEKPMALNVEECDAIIAAAKQNDATVCVAHSDLFYSPFLRAKDRLARGEIGDFMGMRILFSTPTDYMVSKEDHWAHKLPGGVIGETGPHAVYMALAFINPIVDVRASGSKQLDYPWSAFEEYRLELVGERATCTVTSVYTTDQWAAQVDLWGTQGMLKLDLELMSMVGYHRPALTPVGIASSGLSESAQLIRDTFRVGTDVLFRRFKSTHDLLIEGFVDSILDRRPPPVSAEEGKEAVRVMASIADKLAGSANSHRPA